MSPALALLACVLCGCVVAAYVSYQDMKRGTRIRRDWRWRWWL